LTSKKRSSSNKPTQVTSLGPYSGKDATLLARAQKAAILAARIAYDKKAEDITILFIRDLLFITDFFVICSGRNRRQLQTISQEIEKSLEENGFKQLGIEGFEKGRWILQDFGSLVVHIFDQEMRQFYQLEELWADAPQVEWKAKTNLKKDYAPGKRKDK
jgi:ribosome-associated protein